METENGLLSKVCKGLLGSDVLEKGLPKFKKNPPPPPRKQSLKGWVCPRCTRINAPFVTFCECEATTKTKTLL